MIDLVNKLRSIGPANGCIFSLSEVVAVSPDPIDGARVVASLEQWNPKRNLSACICDGEIHLHCASKEGTTFEKLSRYVADALSEEIEAGDVAIAGEDDEDSESDDSASEIVADAILENERDNDD